MATEVRDANEQERMHYFLDAVSKLAEDLDLACVLLVSGGESDMAARMPGCADECPTPDRCAVMVYRRASAELRDMADKIEKGDKRVEPVDVEVGGAE